jgi:PAS domain S-box-containing protein
MSTLSAMPLTASLSADTPLPLHQLTRKVASASSAEEIYAPALDCLRDSLGVERSAILLTDPDGVMRFKAWRGLSDGYRQAVEGHTPWAPGEVDPQPVLVPDAAAAPELEPLLPVIRDEGLAALAFIPLVAGGRLLGKFMLYSDSPRDFSESEIIVAQTIAANVAFAIDQHNAREERLLSAALLEGQKRSLELLASGSTLRDVLDSLVHTTEALATGSVSAQIVVFPPEAPPGSIPNDPVRQGLPPGQPPPAEAMNGAAATMNVASAAFGHSEGGTTWSHPVVASDGRVVASFDVHFSEQREPTSRDRQVVAVLAHTAALAIESRYAREERRRQRGHLDAIFRSTVAGIAELDATGGFVAVNDRFCELAGRSREELLGRVDCIEVTHSEDRVETARLFRSLAAGAESFSVEKRLHRPDGATVWVNSSASAIRDAQGRFAGAVVILTDITNRRRGEAALRESEARYRTLLNSMGIAAYTTDSDGYITMFNDAAAQLWGRAPALGEDRWCGSWRIFRLDGEHLPHEDCPMGICLREQLPVRGVEIVVERPDGSRGVVMPYPTPLFDDAGNISGAINVLVDVTEQRRTQDALRDAVREKDDFLGQISHELRNPVTQLEGYADLLRRRWESMPLDAQLESLQEVHSQSIRVRRLVENMIVLSRFERGVMPGTEPHLLQRLLDETLQEFRRRFPRTRLEVDVRPDLPPVETSASTVDQVVWNLLTNAYKYGPAEGPIRLEASMSDGWVTVAIRDTGPGVPPDDLESIFEPYFRSASTPEHAAGLGLGLSVCRRLMHAQQGEMWAKPLDGAGMEFGFRLRALDDLRD